MRPSDVWENLEIGDCWEWQKSCRPYGQATIDGAHHQTHRWVYEQLVGPIPEGLVIDHLCGNKKCANPDHLEPVTQQENLLRRFGGTKTCQRGHSMHDAYVKKTGPKAGQRQCRTCHRDKEMA